MISRIHSKRRGHSVTNQPYQNLTNAMEELYLRLKPLYLLASVLFPSLYLFLELVCVNLANRLGYLLMCSVHRFKRMPLFFISLGENLSGGGRLASQMLMPMTSEGLRGTGQLCFSFLSPLGCWVEENKGPSHRSVASFQQALAMFLQTFLCLLS